MKSIGHFEVAIGKKKLLYILLLLRDLGDLVPGLH